jgi:hypothetical protein
MFDQVVAARIARRIELRMPRRRIAGDRGEDAGDRGVVGALASVIHGL